MLVAFLRVLWVEQLEVEEGERDETASLGWLREAILATPADDRVAWATLIEKAFRAAADRSGADARRLRQVLVLAGVRLAVPVDIRADVERLAVRSETALTHLASHAGLRIGSLQRRLDRVLATPLVERARAGSALLVGVPGAGKTGALFALAEDLRRDGHDLVVIAADTMRLNDLDDLRAKFQLTRPLTDVLADWPGEKAGILIIDALDAARGPDGPAALIELIEHVAGTEGRWHVIASVRTFDLRHNRQLRAALAPISGSSTFMLDEFLDVEHFFIDELTNEELAQLADVAPEVDAVLSSAPARLRQLVANPFNLSLLTTLVERRVDSAELRPLRTQLELLDLYWRTLVLSPAADSDARVAVLGAVCRQALSEMRLQVERLAVIGPGPGDALRQLLSAGVLLEVPAGGVLEPERVAFSHHVLFDYAFARLVLANPDRLSTQLTEDPDIVLLARPALVMALSDLWERGGARDEFWAVALALAGDEMDDPVRLVAPSVIVELVGPPEDLSDLIEKGRSTEDRGHRARELLAEIVQALIAAGPDTRPLQHADVGLWATVAAVIAKDFNPGMIGTLQMLVWALWREAEAAPCEETPNREGEPHRPTGSGSTS